MAHRKAHRRLARRTIFAATVSLAVFVPAASALACGGLVTPNEGTEARVLPSNRDLAKEEPPMAHRKAHRRLARRTIFAATVSLAVVVPAASALACGGLVTPNGTVNLVRTTTLAAYHAGVEHYVTSFEFAGVDATEVGSIVPLPGVPTKVIKGGDWTLQRLILETQPPEQRTFALAAEAGAADSATVLLETQIDALDITVLEGGAVAVGTWASDHGFFLPPDAPEVLEFYAQRSPIFMAVKFDVGRANEQGVQQGQGTPVHVVIPTPNPWVPLRILALGRQEAELVQADVYLLTDVRPATLPLAVRPNGDPDQRGLIQEVSEPASTSLLADLRSDRGMKWMPTDQMWLTKINVNATAGTLTHDLAVDASGFGQPSPAAAGLRPSHLPISNASLWPILWVALASVVVLGGVGILTSRRSTSHATAR